MAAEPLLDLISMPKRFGIRLNAVYRSDWLRAQWTAGKCYPTRLKFYGSATAPTP
jgi:hypothetical protein